MDLVYTVDPVEPRLALNIVTFSIGEINGVLRIDNKGSFTPYGALRFLFLLPLGGCPDLTLLPPFGRLGGGEGYDYEQD